MIEDDLVWRVFCELDGCGWVRENCEDRAHAALLDRAHAATCSHAVDGWQYRVQGVSTTDAPN